MNNLLQNPDGGRRINNTAATAASTSMEYLERRKQKDAKAFSHDFLTSLESGRNGSGDQSIGPEQAGNAIREQIKTEIRDDDDIQYDFYQSRKVETKLIISEENCNHEVVYPYDMEYTPLITITDPPPKKWEFQLDLFQKQANKCLENNQSVLVSAHTSAGKTVVALYAIALAIRNKQHVIYTTPIKALSNQKYRQLSEEFRDVGLITGDVTINPNAAVLVVTTEILRSMIFHHNELIGKVGWIIFDEFHYMCNRDRGIVWEEIITLLQCNARFVLLSATISNPLQFAGWISHVQHQFCHVICTNHRPVPLQHYIFTIGGEGLFKVLDHKGHFNQDSFQNAMKFLIDKESQRNGDNAINSKSKRRNTGVEANAMVKIVRTLIERKMLPCIIFSFSRMDCEQYAKNVSNLDLNTEEEKHTIKLIFENAIEPLSDQDRQLPQIKNMLPILMRGVAVHHSGMLPILREIVEILLEDGLVKALFATETFAMGINMPAKTVVFSPHSARKFDGNINRWITSGEYIQMSGRAGRRGKDDMGMVILMLDTNMSVEHAKNFFEGECDPLNSQFRLTYNTLLNILNIPVLSPEKFLQTCFYQWQNCSSSRRLKQNLNDKRLALKNLNLQHEEQLKNYNDIEKEITKLKNSIREKIMTPFKIVPFFKPGRMLKIQYSGKSGCVDYDWGVLFNWCKTVNPVNPESNERIYIIEVAIIISKESERHLPNLNMLHPPGPDEAGVISVIPFTIDCINAISTIRLKIPEELRSREAKEFLTKTLLETKKRFDGVIPELNPVEDLLISDPEVKSMLLKQQKLEDDLKCHRIKKHINFKELYELFLQKQQLEDECRIAQQKYESAFKLPFKKELEARIHVLQNFGYISEDNTIIEKGKIACELTIGDGILLTELLFAGDFSELTPSEAAALLSVFVFEEQIKIGKLNEKLDKCYHSLKTQARRLIKTSIEFGLDLDEQKYFERLSGGMMDVVFRWCEGETFESILSNTQLFEGSIVRCLRRLDELLKEMINASNLAIDSQLSEKFERARKLLRRERGVVFSRSLYV